MSSEVMYRRWRPQSFGDVVGQDAITRTIANAVSNSRLAHAYLFCGPRGTGKTSLGRLLAKAVNCEQALDGEPCNVCPSCKAYLEGNAIDLVEMDAASNRGIDEIRRLRDRVGLAPMGGRYKVYLIDEVHMLTQEADNALLKTLEEPPPHVIFVLATTEPHKVPATVISRCQRFDFRRITAVAAADRLSYICKREEIEADSDVLYEIARSSRGSLRDAINLLEQLAVSHGAQLSMTQVQEALGLTADARVSDVARSVLSKDLTAGLRLISAVRDDGVDMRAFGRDLVAYLRNLMLLKADAEDALDVTAEQKMEMRSLEADASSEDILRCLRLFSAADVANDAQASLAIELALAEYVIGGSASPAFQAEVANAHSPEPAHIVPTPIRPLSNGTSLTHDSPAASNGGLAVPGQQLPQDFLEKLRLVCKDADKQVAALMNGSCEVKGMLEDRLVLGFYYPFHKQKIEAPLNIKVVEDAASRLLGRTVGVSCVLTQRERQEGQPRGGHLLRAAREMGARPLVLKGEGDATGDESE